MYVLSFGGPTYGVDRKARIDAAVRASMSRRTMRAILHRHWRLRFGGYKDRAVVRAFARFPGRVAAVRKAFRDGPGC
jgi:hypothetical protein